jgi:hypothetical protein
VKSATRQVLLKPDLSRASSSPDEDALARHWALTAADRAEVVLSYDIDHLTRPTRPGARALGRLALPLPGRALTVGYAHYAHARGPSLCRPVGSDSR